MLIMNILERTSYITSRYNAQEERGEQKPFD